jgi:3-deoxy-D-manno-octulosonate 8-phosphate phosphatase, yrbI family
MGIRCLVLDVDGVLTKGDITYTSSGEELKTFHAKDGMGLAIAHSMGLQTAIITGRTSPIVERRAKELNISHIQMGSHNKSVGLQVVLDTLQLEAHEVAYMGDDLNDLGVMSRVGLAMTPQDGVAEIKDIAHYICQANGGEGAVREAVEYILKREGLWEEAVRKYREETYQAGQ